MSVLTYHGNQKRERYGFSTYNIMENKIESPLS